MNYKVNLESNSLPRDTINEKSHEKITLGNLHISFAIVIDGLGWRAETTFSSSLIADCTAGYSTVQLTNNIFCCSFDNLSSYSDNVIWKFMGHTCDLQQRRITIRSCQHYLLSDLEG